MLGFNSSLSLRVQESESIAIMTNSSLPLPFHYYLHRSQPHKEKKKRRKTGPVNLKTHIKKVTAWLQAICQMKDSVRTNSRKREQQQNPSQCSTSWGSNSLLTRQAIPIKSKLHKQTLVQFWTQDCVHKLTI